MNLVSPTMIRYVNMSSNNGSLRYKKNLILLVVGTFDDNISNMVYINSYEELAAHY